MVNLVTLIPSDNSFKNLVRLKGMLRVLQPRGCIGGPTSLLLATVNNFVLRLSVDYKDVVFKFECFGLEVEPVSECFCSNADEIIRIDEWQHIKCLFRFEWQYFTLVGEMPANGQISRARGKRRDVPGTAINVGVSMVGIVFWNYLENLPVALIISDDDDPVTLSVFTEKAKMMEHVNESDCVDIEDISLWIKELNQNA